MSAPGLNQSFVRFRYARCSSPSMWISVLIGTGGAPGSASAPWAAAPSSDVFGKRSGWRSISIRSAWRVTAQNGSKPSASMRGTGVLAAESRGDRVPAAAGRCRPCGSVKIVTGSMNRSPTTSDEDSLVSGTPLSAEPGLGALTIPGYLREVTERFAEREALVWRAEDRVERWTYASLWERSVEVARALIACGVGKDSRVGILMTNRPEFLAAAFGTALAGGVIVTLNTFSTRPELEHLLRASSVSILLFERCIAKKDFAAILARARACSAPGRSGRPLSVPASPRDARRAKERSNAGPISSGVAARRRLPWSRPGPRRCSPRMPVRCSSRPERPARPRASCMLNGRSPSSGGAGAA